MWNELLTTGPVEEGRIETGKAKVLSLVTDIFGNYVIQKFLEFGTTEMHTQLGELLEGKVLELSRNTFGCRVVQRALEVLPSS